MSSLIIKSPQSNQRRNLPMQENYISDLIEIKDPNTIISYSYTEDGIKHIYVEQVKRTHVCPNCGAETAIVHDYRVRNIKHQYNLGNKTVLHYKRRRYVCHMCNKRFPEENSFVEKHHKISSHTKKLILLEYPNKQSIKDLGNRLNISYHTVMRHVNRHIRPTRTTLPEIISIDEFKNLSDGDGKYAFLMVDPIDGSIIDVFPNRRKHNLEAYFMRIPIEERKRVRIVISDLWDPYRKLTARVFPNAILIADKYHFIRQLYWGLQSVRKRIMKQQKEGTIEYYILKKYWKFYLKYSYNLSTNFFKSRRLGYHLTPLQIVDMAKEIHPDLKLAINLKDEFYEFLHTTSFEEAHDKLNEFIIKLKSSNIPEYQYVARTYTNWKTEIINSFYQEISSETGEIYNLTNGFIEGINNKIKVIKRVAFGYRNFNNFRTRIFASINTNLPISNR